MKWATDLKKWVGRHLCRNSIHTSNEIPGRVRTGKLVECHRCGVVRQIVDVEAGPFTLRSWKSMREFERWKEETQYYET
jgi:hypothetical protein